MAIDPARVQSIFLAAVELQDPDERIKIVNSQCADDAELRARVETLLRAHDEPVELPKAGTIDSARERAGTVVDSITATAGKVVAGRYRLLEEIGEGGMGTVWVAEQTEPVRRRVALKLIKAGMDSRQVLVRFEVERQALALMDHPNIAKVLDGGVTEQGHPFFAMEYVKGVPITEYCDSAKVTVEGRLKLFSQVCQAVQHAHQKGIIHRDLKPSNILVCLYDGLPVPKVIDFGLAKAINQPLTEHTLYTAHGAMVGTPLYMSPEQAEFNNLDIDTRTDIYSLGVILYELLTGATPLDRQRFKNAAWQEIVRLIKEEEPSKPSTKLSGSGSLPSVAAQRSLEPAQLTRVVRGDLDWIVMKSLEKERSRRYETANGLARDLQRYLADEVIEARPPSAGYRLRKLVRRNRGLVAAVGLIALTLVCGIAGTTWGMIRAVQAQHAEAERAEGERLAKLDAEAQKTRAVAAASAEKAANEQAQKRLVQIEKGNEIITSIFTDLDIRKVKKGTEPLEAVLAQRLVKAAGQLEGEAVGDPLVVAGLQRRLGLSLLSLGHPTDAIPLFVKAGETRRSQLGGEHADALTSMNDLALSYEAAGKLDLALPLFEKTLRLRKAALGANHPDTLESMNDLALGYRDAGKVAPAVSLLEETVRLRKATLGPDDPNTLSSMNNLAESYAAVGKPELALPLYKETLKLRQIKLGADHPDTLESMNNLAVEFGSDGKADLALLYFEETLKLSKARFGADHPRTLVSMNNLAMGYQAAGKLDLAVPLFEETLKLSRAKLGTDHPRTLLCMNSLARGYMLIGKADLAVPLLEETLKLSKDKLGLDHPVTLASMDNLAVTYQATGKLDLSLPLFEEALKLKRAKYGTDHAETRASLQGLALAHLSMAVHQAWLHRDKEYAETCRRALKLGEGSNDPETLDRVAKACSVCPSDDRARLADSLNLGRRAFKLGRRHRYVCYFLMGLGMCEFRSGHWTEANAALSAAMTRGEQIRPVWLTCAFYRAMNLFRQGKLEEARKLAAAAALKMTPLPRDEKEYLAHDDLIIWMAYKEAKQLLNLDSTSATAHQPNQK